MDRKPQPDRPVRPSRREALRRLAGAAIAAYVVPEVLFLSEARAESSAPSAPTAPTAPTAPSVPVPSAPDPGTEPDESTPGSGAGPSDAEDVARDTCSISSSQDPDTISISRSDLARSQDAVKAGYARPLDQIWGTFISSYDGKIIGVEFIDRQTNPRYRFRAISKAGRLETVTISAQTGVIQRIVGC